MKSIFLSLGLLTALCTPSLGYGAAQVHLKSGTQAPEFNLKTLEGKALKFSSFKGKAVLVNFWASWCSPCIAELPSIVALWDKFHARGFEVVAINGDEEPKTGVPPVVAKLKLPFTIYVDPDGALSKKLDVASFPFSFLVDGKGKIVRVVEKDLNWNSAEIQAEVEKLLR